MMGLLATLYTVLGGIEAVIWTDVLQTVVLLGGAHRTRHERPDPAVVRRHADAGRSGGPCDCRRICRRHVESRLEHSIATSVVTDWLKPNGAARSEADWLRIARHVTLTAGLFGTLTAALLATHESKSLWDDFLGLMGLLGGTLACVMAAALADRRGKLRQTFIASALLFG